MAEVAREVAARQEDEEGGILPDAILHTRLGWRLVNIEPDLVSAAGLVVPRPTQLLALLLQQLLEASDLRAAVVLGVAHEQPEPLRLPHLLQHCTAALLAQPSRRRAVRESHAQLGTRLLQRHVRQNARLQTQLLLQPIDCSLGLVLLAVKPATPEPFGRADVNEARHCAAVDRGTPSTARLHRIQTSADLKVHVPA